MLEKIVFLVCFNGLLAVSVLAQTPCPGIFQYGYEREQLIGYIQLPSMYSDLSTVKLQVQFSIGNLVKGYSGRIELQNDTVQSDSLRYKIYFPYWSNIAPQITKISANDNDICFGATIDRNRVPVLTTVTLAHNLFKSSPLSSTGANQPKRQNSQTVNFNPQLPDNPFPFNSGNKPVKVFFEPQPQAQRQPENGGGGGFFLQFGDMSKQPIFNPGAQVPGSNLFGNLFPNPNPQRTGNQNKESDTTKPPKVGEDDLPTVESNLVQRPREECGMKHVGSTLMVNGQTSSRDAHPWLAALFNQHEGQPKFLCGSTLVSKRHVLTAAHCIKPNGNQFKPEDILIVLGRQNIQRWSNTDGAVVTEALSLQPHPSYDPSTADADVGIIRLKDEVDYTTYIRPICLWTGNVEQKMIFNKNGTVTGWGQDENGRLFTPEPKELTVPIVSEEVCLWSNPGFGSITSSRTFCAGSRDGSGPCHGDSGSGFVMERSGRWTLRGVVSMSLQGHNKTCNLKEYIVYTDAAQFTPWISSFVS